MKVAIFEVCRRPEVPKANTEAQVLSQCFARMGVEFALHSNDAIWADHPNRISPTDREQIRTVMRDPQVTVTHFATHGDATGLILQWGGPIGERVPTDVLSGPEIRTMDVFRDKIVVSGACGSAHLASDFLAAGAAAFIAPDVEIPWKNLGVLFEAFYASLRTGLSAERALASAVVGHDELASYRVYSKLSPS